MTSRRLSALLGALSFVLVAVVWEVIGRQTKNTLFFVPLSTIGASAVDLARSGELWRHMSTSLTEFIIGFFIAGVVGILIGAVMSAHWIARDFLEPWVAALYTVPIIALGPLFIIWWGLGIESKVVVISLVAVFPITLNTFVGLDQVDSHLVEVVRSFGARPIETYTMVRFPSALPSILTGLRIGLRGGLVAVVVAELFGSRSGLGWLILNAAQSFQTAQLFVGVLTLSLLGVLGFQLLRVAERVLVPWHELRER